MGKTQMKQTTLNTWLFKLPFKFAIISFALILLLSFLYPFVGQLFFDETHALPMKPLFIFMIISILTGIYFSVKKAPRIKMDTSSFITIHTAQTLLILTTQALKCMLVTTSFGMSPASLFNV